MLLTRPLYRLYEDRLVRSIRRGRLPQHIGVILDGHRRFARRSGRDYVDAYRAGMDTFVETLRWCGELEVPVLTCWLLSQENLERPEEELDPYYEVLTELFNRLADEVPGVQFGVVGSLHLLPEPLRQSAKALMGRSTPGGRRLNIGLAYGGRQEIVDAVRDLVAKLVADGVPADQLADTIDAAGIASNLYSADLPDPDLVIRTSGESRLSGFLLCYRMLSTTNPFT